MLRIDLLPSYVAQRRLTRQLTVLFMCLLAAIIVLGLGYSIPIKQASADFAAKATVAEGFQTQVTGLQTDKAAIDALKPPYDTKIKFCDDVQAHNLAYPTLYHKLAEYTVPSILYSSMSVTGTSLGIAAYTPSLPELSNYLAHIWNDPDLKSVTVSAFPGYRDEYDPKSTDYNLPELPPGYFAHFKNSAQLVKSFKVAGGQIVSISSGNETGSPQTPETTNTTKPKFDARHNGFDFTVNAVLKDEIPDVADPGGAAPAGGKPA